jgi:hypothetical protein
VSRTAKRAERARDADVARVFDGLAADAGDLAHVRAFVEHRGQHGLQEMLAACLRR